MWERLINKAKAAIPKVAKAVGGAVESAEKAAVSVEKKVGEAIKTSAAGKLVSQAAAAVPAFVQNVGEVVSKARAAIPKYVNAAKQKAAQAGEAVRQKTAQVAAAVGQAAETAAQHAGRSMQGVYMDMQARNNNILSRIQDEFGLYYQEVIRGVTQKGIFYFQSSAAGDALDLILQMRKAVVEEYPILTWGERQLQGIHQAVRTGIIEGGDKFGNWVYNQDILVLSGLTGGLFHASDMEGRDATVSSTVGAFLNGVLGKGVLGTADGIAGLVADPYGAVEGINNILRRPEESVPAIWREVKKAWNDNIIEGSAEDRSRAAGATAFEILFLIGTLGGGSAAEAAEVSKAAEAAEDFGDLGKLANQASEAGRLAGNLDGITGIGKTAETAEAGKIVSSTQAGQAAHYLDDIISNIRKLLNPQEPQLALAMGPMDDTGEAGYFTKLYEELMKKQEVKQSSGGVRINKTAGVGDDAFVHEGGRESKIGDFTSLEGSTVDDILDRIPDEATLRELHPVQGGATDGFEFKWVQDGQTYRVRVHSSDPGAPTGSNASNGWVVRIQRGKHYYDPTINDFRPAKYTNPNGDFFDESIMNNTHIPIKDPYKP